MNKKPKPNPRHVNVPFGPLSVMPRGARKRINKTNSKLKGKKPIDLSEYQKACKK